MNCWIIVQNIVDLRQKIASENDPERRRVLRDLLRAETRKLEIQANDSVRPSRRAVATTPDGRTADIAGENRE